MRAVVVSLVIVFAASVVAAGFGLVVGLTPHSTGGASDRPLIYWLIAPCLLLVSVIFWPVLLSWYVALELPKWHRECLTRTNKPRGLEDIRRGRTILDLSQSVDPDRRLGLAGAVVGYGLFYVLLSVPMPIFFGVAATSGNDLALEEAVPLALALWIPVLWCTTLLVRSRDKHAVTHG